MKKFRERFWKRCLAVLLAAAMTFSADVPGADVITAYAAETGTGSENMAIENYRAIAFADEDEFNRIRQNPGLLWAEAEEGSLSSYESKWQSGADIGTLLEELSKEGLYAYVEPRNPNVADHTVNIPAAMKGVIISTGWYEEPDSGTGYDFNIAADVLNIAGAETCVYFDYTGVDTGDSDVFRICFQTAENNSSRVVFKESFIDASIVCDSESGTIEFSNSNIIRGYNTKCATEFTEQANLLVKDAAGLSFEKIAGNTDVTIVFNGYPENVDYLPHFNQEIDLGMGQDAEGKEYEQSVCIQFWKPETEPFWLDDTEEDWWTAASAQELARGTQIAYYAGTTRNEKERIGRHVCYVFEDEQGNIRNDIYVSPQTGKLEQNGIEEEKSGYSVLKLDASSFEQVKGHLGGTTGGKEGSQDILWNESGYGLSWEETDDLDACLRDGSVEYIVIQARKASHNSPDKTLELPENIKGAILVCEWDEEANRPVSWLLNTLKIDGAAEVWLDEADIDTQGSELCIIAEDAGSKVRFYKCTVNALINCDSAHGAVVFARTNTVGGYRANPRGVTEFVTNGELLVNGAAGLSFEKIHADGNVTIVFNGYPEKEYLPRFNQGIDLGTELNEDGHEPSLCIQFWQQQDLPFGTDGTENWWEAVPAVKLEKGKQIAYFAGETYNQRRSIGQKVSYYGHGGASDGLWLNHATGRLERDGEEEESGAYAVFPVESAERLKELREKDRDYLWSEEAHALWDATDTLEALTEYLGTDGLEYVVIQATKASHNSENRTLELPANIKGAMLISDWDNEADKSVEWQLSALKIKGETEVQLCELNMDPMGEEFTVTAEAKNVFVGVTGSEIDGNFTASGTADVLLRGATVGGTVKVDGNLGLSGMIVADGLSGYSKLSIEGHALLVVRNPQAVVIENCEFIKKNDRDDHLIIAYNGYPEASALPVLNGDFVFPEGCGIGLRFMKKRTTEFWKEDKWFDEKTADIPLPSGTPIAVSGLEGEKFEGIKQLLWYYAPEKYEQNNIGVELVGTEEGKLVIQRQPNPPAPGEGLKVELINSEETYTYTGSAIKPAIRVTNNGEELTEGVDYTVKYSNNIKANDKVDKKKQAKITVTGKGNLTSSASTTFEIMPKSIEDADVEQGNIVIAKGTKPAPVLVYNNKQLTTKDYTIGTRGEDGKLIPAGKLSQDGEFVVVGKGNFTGEIPVHVTVKAKSELKKFTVVVGKEKLTYNGKEQKISFDVYDSKDKKKEKKLEENADYIVVYPENLKDAGTVKFTVVGMGEYTGSVTKSYRIKPLVAAAGSMKASDVSAKVYDYRRSGATLGDDLVVTYKASEESEDVTLTEGKDYKVTYSNNKKVSTEKSKAKYTVTFLGNYKGTKALKGTFNVGAASLSGAKVVAADKVYTGKPNTYVSKPYVTIDGVALKTSDYTVKYYKDKSMTEEISRKNKLALAPEDADATVYVKVTGKGNYASEGSEAFGEYKVCRTSKKQGEEIYDLSKAKVTFYADLERTQKVTKVEYTGNALEPAVKVEYKIGKKYVTLYEGIDYEVTYVNNVNKGKATVVITGKGEKYVGSKTASFSIVAKNVKKVGDLLFTALGL